jgi:hypothetical protein
MVLFEKCCCFFRLTTGGMILGWLGAVESLFVMALSIIGLVNVENIMNHLRNETESYTAQSINETHLSIFRRHQGEMTAEDAMIIERGNDDEAFVDSNVCRVLKVSHFRRDVRGALAQLDRQLRDLDFLAVADNRCN